MLYEDHPQHYHHRHDVIPAKPMLHLTSVPSSCRNMSRPLLAHSLARVLLLVLTMPHSRGSTYARTAVRRASCEAAADSTAGSAKGSPTAGERLLLAAPAVLAAVAAATGVDGGGWKDDTNSLANLQRTGAVGDKGAKVMRRNSLTQQYVQRAHCNASSMTHTNNTCAGTEHS